MRARSGPASTDSYAMMRGLLATAVLLLVMVGPAISCAPAQTPASEAGAVRVGTAVGDRAPDFTLRLVEGTEVSSAGLLREQRPVFLFFFTTW